MMAAEKANECRMQSDAGSQQEHAAQDGMQPI